MSSAENQPVESQSVKTAWSAVQVYALSIVCLIVGIGAGYLLRGSASTQATGTPAAVEQKNAQGMGGMPGMQGGAPPTADQLKQMAEKRVAPLLEQLKQNPNDNETILKIAGFYFAARQFDDAAQYFERSAKLQPNAEVLTRLSSAYYYGGSSDKAVATLNQALQLDPKNANALYNLGMLKWQVQGDSKGAVECWQKLLKTNPNHPQRAQVEKMIAVVKKHKDMPAGEKQNAPAM